MKVTSIKERRPRPEADLTELEGDFHSAASMSHIAVELFEHNLGHSHENVTGHPKKYHLDAEDVDGMLYAAYETHRMVKDLRERFLDALKLEY
jgi:hypothetical protein